MFTVTAYKVVFFMRQFRFRQSTTNRYKAIRIYLSIGIDNRYQSITTRIFAIDWSSIINSNRLIDIDWYRLISIVIDSIDWIPQEVVQALQTITNKLQDHTARFLLLVYTTLRDKPKNMTERC